MTRFGKPKGALGVRTQIRDGEDLTVGFRRNRDGTVEGCIICCDCGLVHRIRVSAPPALAESISIHAWRDGATTKLVRLANGK